MTHFNLAGSLAFVGELMHDSAEPGHDRQGRALQIVTRLCSEFGGPLLAAETPEGMKARFDNLLGHEDLPESFEALGDNLPILMERPLPARTMAEILGPQAAAVFAEASRLSNVTAALAEQLHSLGERKPKFVFVLRLRPTHVYNDPPPPPEVMDLVFEYYKMPLAIFALLEAVRQDRTLVNWRGEIIANTILRAMQANMGLFASLGVPVFEHDVRAEDKLDLAVIFQEMKETRAMWKDEARLFLKEKSNPHHLPPA